MKDQPGRDGRRYPLERNAAFASSALMALSAIMIVTGLLCLQSDPLVSIVALVGGGAAAWRGASWAPPEK